MKIVQNFGRSVLYAVRIIVGLWVYFVSKKTPRYAHYGMVALFCMTQGKSNDALSRVIGAVKRPYRFGHADGVLGNMLEPTVIDPIISALRNRGYFVFRKCLSDQTCNRLEQFALSQSCTVRPMDGGNSGEIVRAIYPRDAPRAVRYDIETADLLRNYDVQKLLSDLSLAAVAQKYFGARPTVDVVTMWWHTAFSGHPDSEAGQFFHFDMDRPKWLKFFIYLTDVEATSGPHSFIAGSHRAGGIPRHLLRKGYARLSDQEVASAFSSNDFIEFAAPRGTIIAEDTRGLHKGKHVESGDRLMLQIQFSNSIFGGTHPEAKIGGEICADLRNRIKEFPGIYAGYLR